ncbi:putative Hsp90 co-chaperone Cdc37-like 1-like protein [Naja naja]|nr:putative Hsp90 co-chaperone Cdc37-like 1-like protein [Naja naja]
MALWPPRSREAPSGPVEDFSHLSAQTYNDGIELACQQQKEFVKSSVECKWNLAEAQQKLGNLALHNSESLDQEHAKAQTEINELRWREEEWRRKEEVLRQKERQNLWNTDFVSKESFINQKNGKKLRMMHLNHLCKNMRKKLDILTGDEGYLEAFKNELEAFKSRVRICSQSQNCQAMPIQNPLFHNDLNCIGGLAPQNAESLQGCSLQGLVVHREEEEAKMMDTV